MPKPTNNDFLTLSENNDSENDLYSSSSVLVPETSSDNENYFKRSLIPYLEIDIVPETPSSQFNSSDEEEYDFSVDYSDIDELPGTRQDQKDKPTSSSPVSVFTVDPIRDNNVLFQKTSPVYPNTMTPPKSKQHLHRFGLLSVPEYFHDGSKPSADEIHRKHQEVESWHNKRKDLPTARVLSFEDEKENKQPASPLKKAKF